METKANQDNMSLHWKQEGVSKVLYAVVPIMDKMKCFQRKQQTCEHDGEMGVNHTKCQKMADAINEHKHLVFVSTYDRVIRKYNGSS